MQVPLSRPWIEEEEAQAAADVVRSGWLISGPLVEEFERRFAERLGAAEAVAVDTGSSALLVALSAMGVGPGDEVLVPDMTFVSTATAAMFLGARPVFVDINLENYCFDPKDAERKITARTKAVIPVHYAGHAADMDEVMDLADRNGLRVLEDAAESHLTQYRGAAYTGTIGDAGIFSFTPSKPMTTGEGGMIVTADTDLAARCRLLRNMGDAGKFRWDTLGFNFRMPEMMGAIGLRQLDKLDRTVRLRRAVAARYTDALREEVAVITPRRRTPDDTNYQLYTIRLRPELLTVDRDAIIEALDARGVATRLYYPTLHDQGVFSRFEGQPGDAELPNAVTFRQTALSLPMFPTLSAAEQDYVIAVLRDTLREYAR